jgi:N-acetylmuramic acid 6-phosphate (MurNAc-6-P) etherase
VSSRIDFDPHSVFGRKIAELMASLVEVRNKSANIKAVLDSMALGGSYGQVETEVGGMAAGGGEALYNILTGINQKLASNTLDDIWKLYRG